VSPGCENCYAEAFSKRTGNAVWGKNAPRRLFGEKHWNEPVKWNRQAEAEGRRHRVFCASMADVFEDRRDLDGERARLWALIAETPWLDWQLLTKRPANVAGMVPWGDEWPANVWLGTTVEDQRRADERIPELLSIPAKVRFLSCEPLLGWVDLGVTDHRGHEREFYGIGYVCLACSTDNELVPWLTYEPAGIHWVIVGGESGSKRRPLDLEHARYLRDQCVGAGVPFFFKQVGGRTAKAGGDLLDGVAWKQCPEEVA
jgi:protein gp37